MQDYLKLNISSPPIIYTWECIAPTKVKGVDPTLYIGQAKTNRAYSRYVEHILAHDHLGLSMRKYGLENFKYSVIKVLSSDEELNEEEKRQIFIARAKGIVLYNISSGGQGVERGKNIGQVLRRKKTEKEKLTKKYEKKFGEIPLKSWTANDIRNKLLLTKEVKNEKS